MDKLEFKQEGDNYIVMYKNEVCGQLRMIDDVWHLRTLDDLYFDMADLKQVIEFVGTLEAIQPTKT